MEYKYHTFDWGLIFARMLKDRNKFMRHSEVTPWFNLIYESGLLANWWSNIDNLNPAQNTDKILHL